MGSLARRQIDRLANGAVRDGLGHFTLWRMNTRISNGRRGGLREAVQAGALTTLTGGLYYAPQRPASARRRIDHARSHTVVRGIIGQVKSSTGAWRAVTRKNLTPNKTCESV